MEIKRNVRRDDALLMEGIVMWDNAMTRMGSDDDDVDS